MTTNNIQEGNKLIAEFMGGILWRVSRNDNIDRIKMTHTAFPDKMLTCKISELRYHSSWDWLMPVVQKIKEVYNTLDLEIALFKENEPLFNMTIFADIQTVWKFCVQFIQWYNIQTPKQQ